MSVSRNAKCLLIPIAMTLMACIVVTLTGCAAVHDAVDAGASCLRTERCWR